MLTGPQLAAPRPPRPFGSYPAQDVTFLLTDLSAVMAETGLEERERAIQSGRPYSEMLPVEYRPSERYRSLFHQALAAGADRVALAVAVVAERVLARRGDRLVLVSLARAGTPVGVLLRRYLAAHHRLEVPHYSISILRGEGIDASAVAYVRRHHPGSAVQFVDGWTGKGAIQRELAAACAGQGPAVGLDPRLAVLADPGHCCELYGTRDDFLIPSACLNATVSGLVSRTVLSRAVLRPGQFHGAKFYRELAGEDVSNLFVDTVAARFPAVAEAGRRLAARLEAEAPRPGWVGAAQVAAIGRRFGIADHHRIKPGVGETTRVLLRRLPWKVLVNPGRERELGHLLQLAAERDVPVEPYPHMTYASCGLIKAVPRRRGTR